MITSRWAHQQHSAQRQLLRCLASSPLAQSGAGPVSWVMTGVGSNTHNGVTRARLDRRDVDAGIAETVERLRSRQLPAIWHVDADSSPADLGTRLEAAGCRPERSAWVMGAALTDLPREQPLPDGVTVEEVTTPSQLRDWFRAAVGVSIDDVGTGDDVRRRLYAGLGLGPGRPWRHWLAADRGRPVGTASALFGDGTVALDHVGVLATHRRRGIGGALTVAVLAAARPLGIESAVLGPSPDGRLLYESLGFELVPALADREYYLPM